MSVPRRLPGLTTSTAGPDEDETAWDYRLCNLAKIKPEPAAEKPE